jgi:hypothetical protein
MTPRFAPGIARIGDTLHLFAPACPSEKTVSIKIHSSPPSWGTSLAPYTWWEASRPRSAEGPGEFVVLGDDGPFTDIIVRAASNPTTPALPTKFDFSGVRRTGSTECSVLPARGDVLSRVIVQAHPRAGIMPVIGPNRYAALMDEHR